MEHILAVVRVGNTTTDSISVQNGLRQGCTLAPTLFNIYYSAVVDHWRRRCDVTGIDVRFKHGRKLIGDRTAKSRLDTGPQAAHEFFKLKSLVSALRNIVNQVKCTVVALNSHIVVLYAFCIA